MNLIEGLAEAGCGGGDAIRISSIPLCLYFGVQGGSLVGGGVKRMQSRARLTKPTSLPEMPTVTTSTRLLNASNCGAATPFTNAFCGRVKSLIVALPQLTSRKMSGLMSSAARCAKLRIDWPQSWGTHRWSWGMTNGPDTYESPNET